MSPPWKLTLNKYSRITVYQNVSGRLQYQRYVDESDIIGFVVVGSGRGGGAFVSPIYGGVLVVSPTSGKDKGNKYHFVTYQIGERFNGLGYADDPEGNVLATIASMAINQLQARSLSLKRKKK